MQKFLNQNQELYTHGGRAFSAMLGVVYLAVIAIWVYAITNALKFKTYETRFVQLTEKAGRLKAQEVAAANMIQNSWRSHQRMHKISSVSGQRTNFYMNQKTAKYLREWRDLRRRNSVLEDSELLIDELRKQNEYFISVYICH